MKSLSSTRVEPVAGCSAEESWKIINFAAVEQSSDVFPFETGNLNPGFCSEHLEDLIIPSGEEEKAFAHVFQCHWIYFSLAELSEPTKGRL